MIFDKRSLEERLRDKIELWRRKEKLDQEGQPLPLNGVQLNEPQEPGQDSNQWAEERLKKVIEWISPSDQEYIHESARAKYETHTNDPILKSNIYEAWKSGDIRHIWIHGKAGSGKTVLCSSIVQNMFEYCRHTVNVGQAMFYFSPSDPSRQTMDDLVRSMVVQLGGQEPRISLLYDAYQSAACERPPLITLLDILRRILRSYDEVFLHLDGLDECPFSQDGHCWIAGEFSNWMKDNPNVRMCLTSRDLVEIQQLVFQTGAVPLALDTPDTMPDIRRYVAASLHHHPNLSKLPPTIRITIENELTEKSNGM
jgi:GTPase SAR1 family protein